MIAIQHASRSRGILVKRFLFVERKRSINFHKKISLDCGIMWYQFQWVFFFLLAPGDTLLEVFQLKSKQIPCIYFSVIDQRVECCGNETFLEYFWTLQSIWGHSRAFLGIPENSRTPWQDLLLLLTKVFLPLNIPNNIISSVLISIEINLSCVNDGFCNPETVNRWVNLCPAP